MKLPLIFVRILTLFLITTLTFLAVGKVTSTYAKNSTSLNYTALGDSITLATYDLGGSLNYVELYKNSIASNLVVSVNLNNLGIGGINSTELLSKVRDDPVFRNSIRDAHVITLMIGYNDYSQARYAYSIHQCGGSDNQDCLRNIVNIYTDNLKNTINEIKSLNSSPNTMIILADNYLPVIANESPNDRLVLINYANQMSSAVHTVGSVNGAYVANVYQAFNGDTGLEDPLQKGYLVLDNTHPSATGHQIIANQFEAFNNNLLAKDTDNDGFSNGREKTMGTDLLASCSNNSSHAAWPPDFNNDGKIRISDINAVVAKYGTTIPRYDLNGDGRVNTPDISIVVSYYGRDCPR